MLYLFKMPIGEAFLTALIGIVGVFAIMALLILLVYAQKYVFKLKFLNGEKEEAKADDTKIEAIFNDNSEETVAAITAAISALLEEESKGSSCAPTFRIKNITLK